MGVKMQYTIHMFVCVCGGGGKIKYTINMFVCLNATLPSKYYFVCVCGRGWGLKCSTLFISLFVCMLPFHLNEKS